MMPRSPDTAARLRGYLELLRPANIATALADVLAGYGVAGRGAPDSLVWLLLATACLYGGGVVLNDYFDRALDSIERPERPIPSGRISARNAGFFGAGLLAVGVAAAGLAGSEAGVVGLSVAVAVVLYDAWGKHQAVVGPLNMGLCRGLNLMLGVAVLPGAIAQHWPLALVPMTYIAAVTVVSRGEVGGGKRPVVLTALILVTGVIGTLAWLASTAASPIWPLAVTAILAWRLLPAFWAAWRDPSPGVLRHAVRTGILSLVLVGTVIAAVYAGMIYSLAVLATAPLAWWLARLFAVT